MKTIAGKIPPKTILIRCGLPATTINSMKQHISEEEDLILCQKHLLDLADLCYRRNYPTFSKFLNERQQAAAYAALSAFSGIEFVLDGGYPMAERKIAGFYPKGVQYDFHTEAPFCILSVSPQNPRFAENLSHRDVLGALMSLQIERECIGDIIFTKDSPAKIYIFILDTMAAFVMDNLTSIRNTAVSLSVIEKGPGTAFDYQPELSALQGSVASLRLDCIVSFVYSLSRSKVSELISGKKVFVNSRLILRTDYMISEGDIISVRGFGRFRFEEVSGTTKKNRCFIHVSKYE